MSSELDRVFEKLAKVLKSLTFAGGGKSGPSLQRMGREGISIDISLKVVRDLDEFLASALGIRDKAEAEPLIDIIEDEKRVKVLVLLPGIRKDDVSVHVTGRTLKVEVAKGEEYFTREIVCASAPDEASVVSAIENNSVVELVFSKKEGP
jgi:HSP20 family molecular chaperone IbpA